MLNNKRVSSVMDVFCIFNAHRRQRCKFTGQKCCIAEIESLSNSLISTWKIILDIGNMIITLKCSGLFLPVCALLGKLKKTIYQNNYTSTKVKATNKPSLMLHFTATLRGPRSQTHFSWSNDPCSLDLALFSCSATHTKWKFVYF